MQRNRRAAIEHEFRRNCGKLLPKPPLRIGENIETWRKVVAHVANIISETGTKKKCLQSVGFRKTAVNFPSARRGYRLMTVRLHVDLTGTTTHGMGVVPGLHVEHGVHAQAESANGERESEAGLLRAEGIKRQRAATGERRACGWQAAGRCGFPRQDE